MARKSGNGTQAARRRGVDIRLLVGLGLVAASVAGVLGIISAADSTTRVYAARAALVPGDRITRTDLVVQSASLGTSAGHYLALSDIPAAGLIVTRAVAEGELVPASAVSSVADAESTSIVLGVSGQLSKSVVSGSDVDIWASRDAGQGQFGPPSVVVSGATVVRIIQPDGLVVKSAALAVEVRVPKSMIARVLEVLANDDEIALVPVSIAVKG